VYLYFKNDEVTVFFKSFVLFSKFNTIMLVKKAELDDRHINSRINDFHCIVFPLEFILHNYDNSNYASLFHTVKLIHIPRVL